MAITTSKSKQDCDVESKSRIDELNDTLLELIFTRLSSWKYLVVSKCVSKRWNSIISNPDFGRQLMPQSLPFTLFDQTCLFTEHPYFRKHNLQLDFIPNTYALNVVANTNDLIVAYKHTNSQKGMFYIANPLTKQYVVVPVPLAKSIREYWNIMVGIAGFVNGVSTVNVSHRSSYGYNHGFRIVHVIGENSKSKSAVQIYSSETGQWKTYLFDFCVCPNWRFKRAITWNNKLHWVERCKIVVIDPFNIDNVAPRILELPIGIGNHSNSILGICQNRLRIAQFEDIAKKNRRMIKIWEIEDYDNFDDLGTNNYVKVKLVIDLELKRSIRKRLFPGIDRYNPLYCHEMVCFHPNDPQIVFFCYDNRLFHCNIVEKKSTEIGSSHLSRGVSVFTHPP